MEEIILLLFKQLIMARKPFKMKSSVAKLINIHIGSKNKTKTKVKRGSSINNGNYGGMMNMGK
jgi:hypothetical protein